MHPPLAGGPRLRVLAGSSPPLPLFLLPALVAALLTGCGGSPPSDSAGSGNVSVAAENAGEMQESLEDAIAIELAPVVRGDLSSIYSTSATLRADKQAKVTARTRGVVRELLVEEGAWVEKGQPMAVLENDEQRIAAEQASATLETRRREYQRAESLHRQDLLSDEAFETVRRETVDAEHTAALADLELSRTVIRATFTGRVLTRHLDVGATVNDGTAVYDIADLSPLYADVQVPERQVAELEPGQAVRLMVDDEDSSGEAVIERIAPAVDPDTGTVKVTLAVRRAVGLRPGSFVRVAIVTDTHLDVPVVPRSALVAEGRRWHLFRLRDDDDKVERLEVARGFEELDRVEILQVLGDARPLAEGDRIVVTGASSLDDGSLVQVIDETKDPPEQEAAAVREEEA